MTQHPLNSESPSGSSPASSSAGAVMAVKKMCRVLERKRRVFLEKDWKSYSHILPQSQFIHLVLIRYSLPCNLSKIMEETGLTSAGASIFVDKLVKNGLVERMDDTNDRRNVRISPTAMGQEIMSRIDARLDEYIYSYFSGFDAAELEMINTASRLICDRIAKAEADGKEN